MVAGELIAGAVLMSAAVIPTAEFPGSSALFAKGTELAWSTAAVVADGTATGVRLGDTCCARNASKSGFREAVEAAVVFCAIPARISASNASPDSISSAVQLKRIRFPVAEFLQGTHCLPTLLVGVYPARGLWLTWWSLRGLRVMWKLV